MNSHQFFFIVGMLYVILAYVQDGKLSFWICWLIGMAFIFLPMVGGLWN